ncbi:MAG: TonB-dependent receptor plug domain-containing protein, partial [Woeseiaceae bacterium]|nr:TonB-dependent receptor plug domain-containing protein [Woeseiaceae bacterium]
MSDDKHFSKPTNVMPIGAKTPLAQAVAIAIATMSVGTFAVAQETADPFEEIIVTATKREMNLQDVPQSIQAFSTDQIDKLGLDNMADYIKAIPSISTVTTVPGRNEVVFRGVSTGTGEWRIDSGSAVYMGDIPMTSATQAVDPRTVDIARIEALPGPQGTLFGASSQSGAIRIIPNSPDASDAYGSIDVSGTYMAEGSSGHKIEGWFNAPLVEDKLAIRAVIFDTRTGGYIDNVLGDNVFTPETNAYVVEKDFNEWEQSGGRLSALWNISDKWDVELMYMNQSQTSQGDWKSDPNRDGLDDLEIVRFHKDIREDDWWIGAMTITGDLGFAELKLVSSVLDREIFYDFDNNVNGQIRSQRVITPYDPDNPDYLSGNVFYDTNFHPATAINDQTAERTTHEIRLVSTSDSRFNWMVGAFYEKTEDKWDYVFDNVENLSETPFGLYWDLANETYIPDTDQWYKEDYESTTDQIAVFGEIGFDITDALSATVGARWFEYARYRQEVKQWPEGNDYLADIYEGKSDDTLYKFSMNYNISDDKMVYMLFSEGFRLGGFNSHKNPSSVLPAEYGPDALTNYEVGLKSRWLDGQLQINASLYRMEWQDIQRGIEDPDDWTANGTVNMGDADISGLEANITWYATDNFKIDASFALNDSELKQDVWLGDLLGLPDPGDQMGAKGQELAIAPDQQGWIGLEYNVPDLFGGLDAWFRYDHTSRSDMSHDWWNAMHAETGNGGRKYIDSGGEGSLQFSVASQGSWSLTLSV